MSYKKILAKLKEGIYDDDFWFEVKWFFPGIWYKIQAFFRRINRSIQFARLAYRNYDFDGHYLYPLMKYKLERMEKCIRNGHAYYADKYADNIKVAIFLLDRLIKHDYLENALGPVHKRWGEMETEFIPAEPVIMNGKEIKCSTSKTTWSKAKNEEDNKKADKAFSEASKHSDMMENQDREYLFDYIKKHLPSWWD